MRVSLMNLGDAPRVFHNRLNHAVVVPTGRVVVADLTPMAIQGLKFGRGETVLVGEPDVVDIPIEMQGVVELLSVLEFEGYERSLQKFLQVIPPGHSTATRPSRMQMRRYLQTMVEDYIAQRNAPEKRPVRDDEDPRVLEKELEKQKHESEQSPVHVLDQAKRDRNLAATEAPHEPPPRPLRVRGAANAPAARQTRKPARAGKRN